MSLHFCKHTDVQSVQSLIFSDASDEANGAVVYARYAHVDHAANTTVATAKSRVAPLAAMSILRMELRETETGLRLTVSVKMHCKCH